MTDTETETTTLNSRLLFDLIRWAEQDEAFEFDLARWGAWDQSAWGWIREDAVDKEARRVARNGACQTAYCMAGQAVNQAGYRMIYNDFAKMSRDLDLPDGTHWTGMALTADECVEQRDTGRKDAKGFPIYEDIPGAETQSIHDVGREVLGLTAREADLFFDGDRDLDDLKALANMFCQDRGLPLLFPYHDVFVDENFDGDDDDNW